MSGLHISGCLTREKQSSLEHFSSTTAAQLKESQHQAACHAGAAEVHMKHFSPNTHRGWHNADKETSGADARAKQWQYEQTTSGKAWSQGSAVIESVGIEPFMRGEGRATGGRGLMQGQAQLTQANCHQQRLKQSRNTLFLHLHRQHSINVPHQIKLVSWFGEAMWEICTTDLKVRLAAPASVDLKQSDKSFFYTMNSNISQ